MKIRMTEHFQGTGQPTLTEGHEYDSKEITLPLCQWLLEHRKAIDITPAPEPSLVFEPEPEIPVKKPVTRARSTKRGRTKNEGD